MFLLWYRISWITRYNRYYIYCGGFVTCARLSLYRKSSFGVGVWYIILTFCGCSMNIFIYFSLLLGFVIYIIYKLNCNRYNNQRQQQVISEEFGLSSGSGSIEKSNGPKKPKWWEIILAKIKLFFIKIRDFIYDNRSTIISIILLLKIILVLIHYYEYISYVDLYSLLNFNDHYYNIIGNLDVDYSGYNLYFLHFLQSLHFTIYEYISIVLTSFLVLFGIDYFNFMGANNTFFTNYKTFIASDINKTFLTMNNSNNNNYVETPLVGEDRWHRWDPVDEEIIAFSLRSFYANNSDLWSRHTSRLYAQDRNTLINEYPNVSSDVQELAYRNACNKVEGSGIFTNPNGERVSLTARQVNLTTLEKVSLGRKLLGVYPLTQGQRFMSQNEIFNAHEYMSKCKLNGNDYHYLVKRVKELDGN